MTTFRVLWPSPLAACVHAGWQHPDCFVEGGELASMLQDVTGLSAWLALPGS